MNSYAQSLLLFWKSFFHLDRQSYLHLDAREDSGCEETQKDENPPRKCQSEQKIWGLFKFCVPFFLAFLLGWSLSYLVPPAPNDKYALAGYNESSPCGESPTEAISKNCVFEVMSFSWLPRVCHDSELEEEFLMGDWHWWSYKSTGASTGGSYELHEVPLTDVATGLHDGLHVTWGYHITHCVFMWRKLQRMAVGGGVIDGYIGNTNHTQHCQELLVPQLGGMHMDEDDEGEEMGGSHGWDDQGSQFRLKFPSCGNMERYQ